MPVLPLSKLRVVEIGTGDALGYCGKLFADFGANVIKIEPPGGDPARKKLAPLLDAGDGPRESGTFAWLNTNKRSITADLDRPAEFEKVRKLLSGADLLLDARHPTAIKASRLSHGELRRSEPGLAITSISWFGEHGPYRDYAVTDSVCRSLAGLVKLVGPIEGPPVLPRDGQVGVVAGLTAFIPSLAGLYGHQGARRFAVSAHEAMLQISEFDTGLALESGFTRPRIGINRFGRGFPVGNFATKNGWLGITVVTPAQWVAFCEMIGLPELGPDPRYSSMAERYLRAEELKRIIEPVLLHRTAMQWFEKGIELRLPLAVVPDMRELLAQQVHRDRGAFAPVQIGGAAFDAPVLPQHLTRSPPKANGRAPLAGGNNDDALPAHLRRATKAATTQDPLPLQGLRIVDLTMGWAGPTATRQMGDLGADIVKVESCQYPDWFRGTDPRGPYHPERTYEKTYWFQMNNRNKRGITLDLTSKIGLSLLKRLLKNADAVIDNYAADVLPRLGLDAPAMLKINPRLVVVTMPAFGMTGAWSGVRAYGSTLEQASGLPSVTGREGDPPTMLHAALGDPVGGLNAAAALMLGFMHQQNTGEGQHIDLSAVEAMLPMLAPSIIEQSATGATGPRIGNRHPAHVPNGCYPCIGEDQWITLAVRSDDEWRSLCGIMHRPDLAADPALATAEGRRAEEDRIEVAIRHWTATVRPDLAMVTLQAKGIPAGVARLPMDLPGDPHLMKVGHWQSVDRPFMGPHLLPSVAYREGDAELPYAIERLAPTLGQHNEEVLRDLLGLGDLEIAELREAEIIGTIATSKKSKAKLAAE